MKKVTVIVGHIENDLCIPLVICLSRQHAVRLLAQIGLKADRKAANFWPLEVSEEYGELPSKVKHGLFKHYYDGCGACYGVSIEQFKYGVPMVKWNLD